MSESDDEIQVIDDRHKHYTRHQKLKYPQFYAKDSKMSEADLKARIKELENEKNQIAIKYNKQQETMKAREEELDKERQLFMHMQQSYKEEIVAIHESIKDAVEHRLLHGERIAADERQQLMNEVKELKDTFASVMQSTMITPVNITPLNTNVLNTTATHTSPQINLMSSTSASNAVNNQNLSFNNISGIPCSAATNITTNTSNVLSHTTPLTPITTSTNQSSNQVFVSMLKKISDQYMSNISQMANNQSHHTLTYSVATTAKVLEEFKIGTQARTYVDHLETQARYNNWPENKLRDILGQRMHKSLSEKYKKFYESHISFAWPAFKEAFVKEFTTRTGQIAAISRAKNLNRDDYTTTFDFIKAYNEIMEEYSESERLLYRTNLVEKLNHKSQDLIAANVLISECSTAEFLDYVMHVDNWNSHSAKKAEEEKILSDAKYSKIPTNYQNPRHQNNNSNNQQTSSYQLLCHWCGGKNHKEEKCYAKRAGLSQDQARADLQTRIAQIRETSQITQSPATLSSRAQENRSNE